MEQTRHGTYALEGGQAAVEHNTNKRRLDAVTREVGVADICTERTRKCHAALQLDESKRVLSRVRVVERAYSPRVRVEA